MGREATLSPLRAVRPFTRLGPSRRRAFGLHLRGCDGTAASRKDAGRDAGHPENGGITAPVDDWSHVPVPPSRLAPIGADRDAGPSLRPTEPKAEVIATCCLRRHGCALCRAAHKMAARRAWYPYGPSALPAAVSERHHQRATLWCWAVDLEPARKKPLPYPTPSVRSIAPSYHKVSIGRAFSGTRCGSSAHLRSHDNHSSGDRRCGRTDVSARRARLASRDPGAFAPLVAVSVRRRRHSDRLLLWLRAGPANPERLELQGARLYAVISNRMKRHTGV